VHLDSKEATFVYENKISERNNKQRREAEEPVR
jgi:hypothetical protein